MRLLLVEDSDRLQRSITLGLRKSGYVVDVCGDGKEGLFQAQSVPYDVIILDIQLPSMDGVSVLRELRRKKIDTHILLLTARDSVEDRVVGLEAGADDYLVKPFDFKELQARIQALCRRRYVQKNPEIIMGPLTVNMVTRTVVLSGSNIELLPREYRLLEYLMIRRGEVVPRSEIEEHLYGDQDDIMSNVIDSTVSQLRKKLSGYSCEPFIQTKRGMGYLIPVDQG